MEKQYDVDLTITGTVSASLLTKLSHEIQLDAPATNWSEDSTITDMEEAMEFIKNSAENEKPLDFRHFDRHEQGFTNLTNFCHENGLSYVLSYSPDVSFEVDDFAYVIYFSPKLNNGHPLRIEGSTSCSMILVKDALSHFNKDSDYKSYLEMMVSPTKGFPDKLVIE